MEIEMKGLPPGIIEDFMRTADRIQEESDARRAKSGEPAKTVLIGTDPSTGRIVIIDGETPPRPPSL